MGISQRKSNMFQYNHNKHYADLLLPQVPSDCRSALDVGCGDGSFARLLADRFSTAVTGIDLERAMIEQARTLAEARSIRFVAADFLQYAFDERFDFIAASASLHHMPFEQALVKMAALLHPGGVLAVLGLFREVGLADRAVALVAAPVNICYSLRRGWVSSGAPIKPPDMSLPEIRQTVSAVLPGAHLRRLLLWRYLLTWQKPQALAEEALCF
jgi:SAM-dependent methyltransferase